MALNAPTAGGTTGSGNFNATTGNSDVNLSHVHSYVGNVTARNTGATDVGVHTHNFNANVSVSNNAPAINAPSVSSSTITTTGNAAAQTASITATALYWIIKT